MLQLAVVLAYLCHVGTSECAAQTAVEIKQLNSQITAKQYNAAALKDIELLQKATRSRPATTDFRALQDQTSRLITLLADSGKTADAQRLAQWHVATATKLYGRDTAEENAALQDKIYLANLLNDRSPEAQETLDRNLKFVQSIFKTGKYQDGQWLHERNKVRLARSIDKSFERVENSLKELEKIAPEYAPKNTAKTKNR
jgi:hypothetical protein